MKLLQSFTKIEGNTINEVAEECGFNFTAKKVKSRFYEEDDDSNPLIVVPDKSIVTRTDTGAYLGTVGSNYGIVQYQEALDFTEEMVKDGGASYIRGGVIGDGRQAFLVMETADFINLGGSDEIKCVFYMTTSHDGSSNLEVVPAFSRTSSGAIITFPKDRKHRLKIKHSKHVGEKVSQARASIKQVKTVWEQFNESFELFRSVKMTKERLEIYLNMVVSGESTRAENIREDIMGIYNSSPYIVSFPSTNKTLLGAYLSVVEYYDKQSLVKKRKYLNETDANIQSKLDGNGAKAKAESYGFALKIQERFSGISLNPNKKDS